MFLSHVGRLTASHFYEVHTRVISQRNSSNPDYVNLIKRLLQYTSIPDVPALKYGRRMEALAIQQYVKIKQCTKQHVVSASGLYVSSLLPFIAASPDGVIKCDKCGNGVLEIKCPISSAHLHPHAAKLSYLARGESESDFVLRKNHAYYAQIQGQMAITGATWADFFVYSTHGHHLERVSFDVSYWSDIKESLVYFFNNELARELISRDIMSSAGNSASYSMLSMDYENLGATASSLEPIPTVSSHETVSTTECVSDLQHTSGTTDHGISATATVAKRSSKRKTVRSRSGRRRKRNIIPGPVYICPVCQARVEDPDSSMAPQQYSIMCDQCGKWYHWGCIGITENSTELNTDYICTCCLHLT